MGEEVAQRHHDIAVRGAERKKQNQKNGRMRGTSGGKGIPAGQIKPPLSSSPGRTEPPGSTVLPEFGCAGAQTELKCEKARPTAAAMGRNPSMDTRATARPHRSLNGGRLAIFAAA